MLNRRFNYYGFDGETYGSVADLRHQTNRNHTEIVVTIFAVLMLVFFTLSMLGIISYAQRFSYLLFFIVAVLFEAFRLVFKRFTASHPTLFMYLTMLFMMVFAIWSSDSEVFQISAIYPVLAMLVGVAFIDNMLRFSMVMGISFIAFIYMSYIHKPPSIAKYDLIYGLVFTLIALGFHFRFQRNRIDQFLAYHKNLQIQRDMEVSSSFDPLSSLLMRARFFTMADSILRARGDSGGYAVMCILDLDSFKQINDHFGHQMGDKAIQTAGEIIWRVLGTDISEKWSFCERAILDEVSFAGRLGGDEFVIFLRDEGWEAAEKRLRDILNSLNAVKMGELEGIHASFGVTEIGEDDTDVDNVYNRADEALYKAKTSGKNMIVKG